MKTMYAVEINDSLGPLYDAEIELEHELEDEYVFDTEKKAERFENAVQLGVNIILATSKSSIGCCDEGMSQIMALITDGLLPEDYTDNDIPIFADVLKDVMARWCKTGLKRSPSESSDDLF